MEVRKTMLRQWWEAGDGEQSALKRAAFKCWAVAKAFVSVATGLGAAYHLYDWWRCREENKSLKEYKAQIGSSEDGLHVRESLKSAEQAGVSGPGGALATPTQPVASNEQRKLAHFECFEQMRQGVPQGATTAKALREADLDFFNRCANEYVRAAMQDLVVSDAERAFNQHLDKFLGNMPFDKVHAFRGKVRDWLLMNNGLAPNAGFKEAVHRSAQHDRAGQMRDAFELYSIGRDPRKAHLNQCLIERSEQVDPLLRLASPFEAELAALKKFIAEVGLPAGPFLDMRHLSQQRSDSVDTDA